MSELIAKVVAEKVKSGHNFSWNGHTFMWDPPAAMTAARRWTCVMCGRAFMDYQGNAYGSATELNCADGQASS